MNAKNIVEVGTAQGWQFYTFAQYVAEKSGHVWSCDIRDVRAKDYAEMYEHVSTFCLGTSVQLSETLQKLDQTIDLFYIDGCRESL
jgi:predicted O-methyltransferase YrrM